MSGLANRQPDFMGWATKADIKCSDGRIIKEDAFKHQDTQKVPLVWSHRHDDIENVLGDVILTHVNGGMRVEGYFNPDLPKAVVAKAIVKHGNLDSLSIWANELVEKITSKGKEVMHGAIREVSLVLAGANPEAKIDWLNLEHAGEGISAGEAIITNGLKIELAHAADGEDKPKEDDDNGADKPKEGEEDQPKTIEDVIDSMDEEQQEVLHALLQAAKDGNLAQNTNASEGDLIHEEGKTGMTKNAFDQNGAGNNGDNVAHGATMTGDATKRPHLSHDQLATIVSTAKKTGSWKEALLAHADEYGITDINLLFPDAKAVESEPELITREQGWVTVVMNGVKKLPFSKIKSLSADVTHDEARAKGYVKGSLKKDEFFGITKRETHPKTIYKKQKLDRDDIIDITEMDVVKWLWGEMLLMLREEIARAILIGDGREPDDEDKIDEDKIRPIAQDHEFYTDVVVVPSNAGGEDYIEAVLRGRKNYKGIGNPTFFTTEDILADLLLLKDRMGRDRFDNITALQTKMRVSNIVTVPVMEGATTTDGELLGVLVNLSDYNVGTTTGGEITRFDDFDIDYNQYKYLIEGRMSGALVKHKRAQVLVRTTGTLVATEDITAPTFNAGTGVVTIPTVTGVSYFNEETDEELTAGAQPALDPGETLYVEARPDDGYMFAHNIDADWEFTRPSA